MAARVIGGALRVAVAAVFFTAGVMKIWDFKHGHSATPDFTLAIQHYKILPWPDATIVLALYLPWLEVVAAIGVFVKRVALGAAAAMLGMTLVFLGALGSAWLRGLDIACGCFGMDEVSTNFPALMLRDAVLLAAVCALLAIERRRARALTAAAQSTPSASRSAEAPPGPC
jgi:uncharacterized membrane protein YphA (DoxX/SURF4 family)